MRLTVTAVDAEAGPRDLLVELPDDATIGELSAALDDDSADRSARPRPLYLGADEVPPDRTVSGSGVRVGSRVGLGGPVGSPDEDLRVDLTGGGPALGDLHLVSGPGAGRIWRLGAGSYEVGSDAACAIVLPGGWRPQRGVWVTVAADASVSWHRDPGAGGDVSVAGIREPEPHAGRGLAADYDLPPPPEPPAEGSGAGGLGFRWDTGDDLVAGPAQLRWVTEPEPDAAVIESDDGIGIDYNRPPRLAPHLDADPLRLPNPPSKPGRHPFPSAIIIGTGVLGLALFLVFQQLFFMVFVLLMPMMACANWVTGRRSNRVARQEAMERYTKRLAVIDGEIQDGVRRERWVRNVTGPDPATVALIATGPGTRLWERRRSDADHLQLRLGTVDSQSVKAIDDPLADENHRTVRWRVDGVPVAVDLAQCGVLGVAGPAPGRAPESGRTPAPVNQLACWFVAQAAVLHRPRDLRIVVLTDPSQHATWSWVRWLPHLRAGAGGPVAAVGNDAESVDQRVAELLAALRTRQQLLDASGGRAIIAEPDVMVVLDGARRLREVPGMVQLLAEGPQVRIFCICLDEQPRLLPEECHAVVEVDASTVTLRRTAVPPVEHIRPDLVGADWCERVARALAPVHDVSPDGEAGIPHQIRLLELLDQDPPDAGAIAEKWERRPATTSFVLGHGYEGPFTLDLVRDGPHGLVAGTTGSGKSELLQSLVVSLAAVNRPDELTFVLVDYKGGSAFSECERLPHTLGMVTDLDAHLVERAMASLGAELRRREHAFARVEAKDLPAYRAKRAADPSLPRIARLVLVIDEFATLVRELPDFVPGLISIAQRGRSLGIHLILATQRPGGAVTADIKANTNLRIALRVTDAVESHDVVDVNDAATIPAVLPGRALMRVGPRMATPFQVAWVGAERPEDEWPDDVRPPASAGGGEAAVPDPAAGTPGEAGASPVPRPAAGVLRSELSWSALGRPTDRPVSDVDPGAPGPVVPTDLHALVAAITEAAAHLDDYEPPPSPWLPALPEHVTLADLPPPEQPDEAATGARSRGAVPVLPFALEDLPGEQRQRAASIDLATFGHLFVIGSPRSGRTQVLRTIAGSVARCAPVVDVHLYGIDAGGGGLAPMSALPHCGAVVSRHDMERLDRLLGRLGDDLSERQARIAAAGASGLVELRRRSPGAERPPHLLVLVDGWDALAPLIEEYDQGRLHGTVTRLLREGAAAGIHLVMTSERALLTGRLSVYNEHKLLLRQADRGDYMIVGIHPSKVPQVVEPGRGWFVASHTEVQVALLPGGEHGQAQSDALARLARVAAAPDGEGARPYPVKPLPNQVEITEVYEQVPEELRRPLWALLGVGGDDGAAVGIDLTTTSAFVVAGAPGSGRSNALAAMAVSLLTGGTNLVVFTPRPSPLRALARYPQVRLFDGGDPPAEEVRQALNERTGPVAVVIDDAELLGSPACDDVLREVAISGRDQGRALVYAGSPDGLAVALGGWISASRRAGRGLLLGPRAMAEGDLIGARLSMSQVRSAGVVGRALIRGAAGMAVSIQVPLTVLRED
jgi:S-DNA-T family DNA segregation ATPase FtsK/SpoIIIE